MEIRDIADRMKEAANAADAVIEEYYKNPSDNAEDLARMILRYITVRLQLPPEEVSENITVMVRSSISRATGISIEELKKMDRPGACGSAPAVLAKKILLFLDIQKKLGVQMPPADAGKIRTVQDLAEELMPLMDKGSFDL